MATAIPALIPLSGDPVRFRNVRNGQLQTWEQVTANGLWWFHRDESTGTPWLAIYTPTGQATTFTSFPKAHRWASNPAAVEWLRQDALQALTGAVRGFRFGPRSTFEQILAGRERMASRALRIHTGRIVIPTAALVAESTCRCGGLLTTVDGLWAHLDVCPTCEGHSRCRPLHAYRTHPAGCDSPEPVPCRHLQCVAPNDLTAEPCIVGACCGRCGKC